MRLVARPTAGQTAFTVVELMVSTAIIALLMLILVQITGQTTNTWRYTTGKAEQFREARNGFETMVRRISQATLNTYWDYEMQGAGTNAKPIGYTRTSELRFITGPMQSGSNNLDGSSTPRRPTHGIFFHAPFGHVSPTASGPEWEDYKGLSGLINTWGYFIEVNDDRKLRPTFLKEKDAPYRIRSRLMELMQPSGAMMSTYMYTSGRESKEPAPFKNYAGLDWFRYPLKSREDADAEKITTHPLAENIIALIILPKLSQQDAKDLGISGNRRDTALAPNYYYHTAELGEAGNGAGLNSKHQLPPLVQVTMVAIDELSAQRLNVQDLTDDPLKIQDSTAFTKADNYKTDLLYDPEAGSESDSLEKRLIDARVNYRIFTTNVILRGAKWSRE